MAGIQHPNAVPLTYLIPGKESRTLSWLTTLHTQRCTTGILVASIQVPELAPVTASIKTLSDDRITWHSVTSRLIEETKSLSITPKLEARSNAALSEDRTPCQICKKSSHRTEICYLNPLGINSKLDLPDDTISNIMENGLPRNVRHNRQKKADEGRVGVRNNERSAMEHGKNVNNDRMADPIMLDSGTTSHLTPHADRVSCPKPSDISFTLADNSQMHATHMGVRKVQMRSGQRSCTVSLSNNLIVPDAAMSLMSVPALVKKEIGVLFMPGYAVLFDLLDSNEVLGFAKQYKDGLFYMADDGTTPSPPHFLSKIGQLKAMMAKLSSPNEHSAQVKKHSDVELTSNDTHTSDSTTFQTMKVAKRSPREIDNAVNIWHLRLGHALSKSSIRRLVNSTTLPHVTCKKRDCEECTKGKFRRSFRGSISDATTIGTLHVDTKGAHETDSAHGHKYFVTITEEHSRFVAVRPIKSKSDAAPAVKRFVRYFEKQTGQVVKKIHTDGGTEFRRALLYLEDSGVQVSITTPYTPESNGLVERAHQTIVANARTCLQQAKLPEMYWDYAVRHVVDCRNAIPNDRTSLTSHKVLFGTAAPYLSHLRPFGFRMLYRPVVPKLRTFSPRAEEGLCLYHEGGGVYNILDGELIVRTKHAEAIEKSFPGNDTEHTFSNSDEEIDYNDDIDNTEEVDTPTTDEDMVNTEGEYTSIAGDHTVPVTEPSALDQDSLTYVPANPSTFNESNMNNDNIEEAALENNPTSHERQGSERYSLRKTSRLQYSATAKAAITNPDTPTLSTALSSAERPKWLDAINEEFKTIIDSKTWTDDEKTSPPVHGQRILPTGIILRVKRDEMGNISRFKARLVVRGNFQNEFEDYAELYAPVASIELVRLIITIAIRSGLVINQLDVKGAFLHALLPESDCIWIYLPKVEGVPNANGRIVKLRKSLYGLRQAPKLWYSHHANALEKIGFRRSQNCDCLFIINESSSPVYIVAYVDDLLVVGPRTLVDKVKLQLSKILSVTDLGTCKHFLGMHILDCSNGVVLSQSSYTERVLASSGMTDSKPVDTPLPLSHTLYRERTPTTENVRQQMSVVPYRSVLGSLIYLSTRTRPDISTAVSLLGKFQSDPTPNDWKALKHLLRYLKRTIRSGIFIPRHSVNKTLDAYSDADWRRD